MDAVGGGLLEGEPNVPAALFCHQAALIEKLALVHGQYSGELPDGFDDPGCGEEAEIVCVGIGFAAEGFDKRREKILGELGVH